MLANHSKSLGASSITLLLVLLAASTSAGCNRGHADTAAPALPLVRVTPVTEREVSNYSYFTGRTDAIESVEIRARVSGYLTEIRFVSGQEVKKGDELFLIDPRPYAADLERAEGQVLLSEAKLKLAKADLSRANEIAKTPGAISKQDLDKYAAALNEAEGTVKAALANEDIAKLNLEFTSVTSPVEGIVGRNLISLGNLVTQDSTKLTTVVSQDPMYAYFDVDEHTMLQVQALIRKGNVKSVRDGARPPFQYGLDTEPGRYPHEGVVDFVNNQIAGSTGTIQIRGVLENPIPEGGGARLLTPGLFIHVRFPIGPPYQALLVPEASIGRDQDKTYVYVVGEGDKIEYRPVTLGPRQTDGLQVVQPQYIALDEQKRVKIVESADDGKPSLAVGDAVVVTGLQRIRSGSIVKPEPYVKTVQ